MYIYIYIYIYTHIEINNNVGALSVLRWTRVGGLDSAVFNNHNIVLCVYLLSLLLLTIMIMIIMIIVMLVKLRSVFKISCLFLRPRLWQFEIWEYGQISNIFAFRIWDAQFDFCDLKLWKLTVGWVGASFVFALTSKRFRALLGVCSGFRSYYHTQVNKQTYNKQTNDHTHGMQ